VIQIGKIGTLVGVAFIEANGRYLVARLSRESSEGGENNGDGNDDTTHGKPFVLLSLRAVYIVIGELAVFSIIKVYHKIINMSIGGGGNLL
jgi:hypothetical protein